MLDTASCTRLAAITKVLTNINASDPLIGTKLEDQIYVLFLALYTTDAFKKQEIKVKS